MVRILLEDLWIKTIRLLLLGNECDDLGDERILRLNIHFIFLYFFYLLLLYKLYFVFFVFFYELLIIYLFVLK